MRSHIIDLEVYPNYYLAGIRDFKEKTTFTFEVNDKKDERQELYEYLINYDGYLVGFNTLHYDEVLLKYFMKDYKRLSQLDVDDFLLDMKEFSDKVIRCEDVPAYFDEIKWYKWYKDYQWTSIDLYCYWSKMLRLSKKISLKSLAIQLNHGHIQELPYHHTQHLSHEEMEEVYRYNTENDLMITEKLFVKMKEDILLRRYIEKEYQIPCYSMDAPKIAGELLIKDYCEQTLDSSGYEDLDEYVREFKKQRYSFYGGKVRDIMGDFKVNFVIPEFKSLYERMMDSDRSFSDEFPLIHEPSKTRIMCSYGVGGAHSIQNNEYYKSDDYQIVTSDYASLYPNIIINWKCIRFPETLEKYRNVKSDRLVAKKEGDKTKDKLLKLILNSKLTRK